MIQEVWLLVYWNWQNLAIFYPQPKILRLNAQDSLINLRNKSLARRTYRKSLSRSPVVSTNKKISYRNITDLRGLNYRSFKWNILPNIYTFITKIGWNFQLCHIFRTTIVTSFFTGLLYSSCTRMERKPRSYLDSLISYNKVISVGSTRIWANRFQTSRWKMEFSDGYASSYKYYPFFIVCRLHLILLNEDSYVKLLETQASSIKKLNSVRTILKCKCPDSFVCTE